MKSALVAVVLFFPLMGGSQAAPSLNGAAAGGIAQGTPKKAPATTASKKADEPSAEEAKAEALVKSLASATKTKLLTLLNKGTDEELESLPGVGEVKAAALKKGRPYESPAAIIEVKGIGLGVLEDIVNHAKAGFPETEPAKKAAPPKKAAATTKKGS